jgi:hypothetical protein
MTSPNPTCTVGGNPTPVDVPPNTVTAGALASTAGAQYWNIAAVNTDDLNTAAAINATLSVNQGAKTFQFTSPGVGSKVIFQSVVGVLGPGLDANGVFQPAFVTTFAVNVKTANGLRVWATSETAEQSVAFGNIVEVNAGIRGAGGGGDQGPIVAPPKASNWSHVNFGVGTTLVDSGQVGFPTIYLSDFTTGGNVNLHGGVDTTHPVTPGARYTLPARFRVNLVPDANSAHNSSAGIMITDGTKIISFMYVYDGASALLQVQEWTNPTTLSGAPLYSQFTHYGVSAPIWGEIQDDGTHRNFTIATDGQNYLPPALIFQHASGTFLTETGLGIMTTPFLAGGGAITLESWNPTFP